MPGVLEEREDLRLLRQRDEVGLDRHAPADRVPEQLVAVADARAAALDHEALAGLDVGGVALLLVLAEERRHGHCEGAGDRAQARQRGRRQAALDLRDRTRREVALAAQLGDGHAERRAELADLAADRFLQRALAGRPRLALPVLHRASLAATVAPCAARRVSSGAARWPHAAPTGHLGREYDEREEQSRDRTGGRAPPDPGDRGGRRPRGRRGRALRPLQGEDPPLGARPAEGQARRQDHLRHGDHADEGRRGQDDDVGLAHAGHGRDRRAGPAVHPRGLARPRLRHQGRRGRSRLRAGRADGGSEPPLHRRHARDLGRQQPARGVPRRARDARQRARHRPALDLAGGAAST